MIASANGFRDAFHLRCHLLSFFSSLPVCAELGPLSVLLNSPSPAYNLPRPPFTGLPPLLGSLDSPCSMISCSGLCAAALLTSTLAGETFSGLVDWPICESHQLCDSRCHLSGRTRLLSLSALSRASSGVLCLLPNEVSTFSAAASSDPVRLYSWLVLSRLSVSWSSL